MQVDNKKKGLQLMKTTEREMEQVKRRRPNLY